MKKSIVIHPFMFAILPIFFLFSYNVGSVFPNEIIPSLLLVIFITFVIWIVLSFVLKSRIKSGLITSLGLVIFFYYGHSFIELHKLLQLDVLDLHSILLITSFILLGLGAYYIIKTKKPLDNLTMIVNVIAIAMVMVSFVNIGEFYLFENYSLNDQVEGLDETPIRIVNAENFPDIYYIIFDGYAGSNALQYFMNFSNTEFIDSLTKKGFHVATESYSNYGDTAFSIPSLVHMKYLNYLADDVGINSTDKMILYEVSRENEVLQYLNSKGYTIFNIESGAKYSKAFNQVDYHLCSNKNPFESDFQMMLIRTTMINPIHVQMFSGDKRDRVLCGFSELDKIVDRDEHPKLVYAHFNIPHGPFIFDENGGIENAKFLTLGDPDPYRYGHDLYLGQLKFANKKIMPILEKLINLEPPPIIILQSDHGFRGREWQNEEEFVLSWFNNFKAYYFPDKGRNLEFESTTSVNTFRILFNLYFDEKYEILEDKIYYADRKTPFQFKDLSHVLIKK